MLIEHGFNKKSDHIVFIKDKEKVALGFVGLTGCPEVEEDGN
jgi:hypothetical protein